MIDNLDRQIIMELYKDGRQRTKHIAKQMGVVEGTVRKRLAKLVDENIIQVSVQPNFEALGYQFLVIIAIQVQHGKQRQVAEKIAKVGHVCHISYVAGSFDLIAIVLAETRTQFANILEEFISSSPHVVKTECFVNLDTIKGKNGFLDTRQIIGHPLHMFNSMK